MAPGVIDGAFLCPVMVTRFGRQIASLPPATRGGNQGTWPATTVHPRYDYPRPLAFAAGSPPLSLIHGLSPLFMRHLPEYPQLDAHNAI